MPARLRKSPSERRRTKSECVGLGFIMDSAASVVIKGKDRGENSRRADGPSAELHARIGLESGSCMKKTTQKKPGV